MNGDRAKKLMEKLKSDQDLAEKIGNCKDMDDCITIFSEHGFQLPTQKAEIHANFNNTPSKQNARNWRCLFEEDIWCLRNLIRAACYCPVNRAYDKKN